jgi:ubiquinone/menaquinone biosynthesis C-methylase UbiE
MTHPAERFGGLDLEHYDAILGPAQLEPIASELSTRLPADPGGDVLELACGTGIVTQQLRARLAPARRLVATDLSPAMVEFARRKLPSEGIEWRQADMAALPFADESFAALVCSLGIMFVPQKEKAYTEARRVLREGGQLLLNTWSGLADNPQARIASEVMEALFPGDVQMQFARIPMGYHDLKVIRGHLEQARLREVAIEREAIPIRCESAQRYATGLIKGTPRALLISERGRSVDEVVDRVAEALVRAGGDRPLQLTAHILVIEARAV